MTAHSLFLQLVMFFGNILAYFFHQLNWFLVIFYETVCNLPLFLQQFQSAVPQTDLTFCQCQCWYYRQNKPTGRQSIKPNKANVLQALQAFTNGSSIGYQSALNAIQNQVQCIILMYSHKLVNSYNLSLTVLKHTSIDSINSQPNNTHFQIHKSSSIQVLSYAHQNKKAYKISQTLKSSFKAKNTNHISDMAVINQQDLIRENKKIKRSQTFNKQILQQLSISY